MKKNTKKLIIFSIIIFAIYYLIPSHSLAATIKLQDPIRGAFGSSKVTTSDDIVNLVIYLLTLLGIIATFIYAAIGGIMYFFAVGNPEQAKKATNMIVYAVIGLAMLLGAYALAQWAVVYVRGF